MAFRHILALDTDRNAYQNGILKIEHHFMCSGRADRLVAEVWQCRLA
jgi:hypothetical protein